MLKGLKMQPGKCRKNISTITSNKNKAGGIDLPSLGISVTKEADNLNNHIFDISFQLPPLKMELLPAY